MSFMNMKSLCATVNPMEGHTYVIVNICPKFCLNVAFLCRLLTIV